MSRSAPILLLLSFVPCLAGGAVSDELTKSDFRASVCNIEQLSVSFNLDEAFGEPLLTSRMRWRAGANTAEDCLGQPTYVFLYFTRRNGERAYIKLSPEIVASGQPFGPAATESPFWNTLICNGTSKSASCLSSEPARQEYAELTGVAGFEVVTEASIVQQITATEPARDQKPRASDENFASDFSFDSLLEQAIDNTILSGEPESGEAPAASQPEPVALPEVDAGPSPEELARQQAVLEEQLAEQAKNNVVTLIATTFAEYSTPAHNCESDRNVANWVRVTGRCEMNFRSESTHDFLCVDSGAPKHITTTRTTDVDFGKDVSELSPLRISEDGWVALVLELREEIAQTNPGNYRANRWQFTGTGDQIEEMKSLASSFATLKAYCEKRSASSG